MIRLTRTQTKLMDRRKEETATCYRTRAGECIDATGSFLSPVFSPEAACSTALPLKADICSRFMLKTTKHEAANPKAQNRTTIQSERKNSRGPETSDGFIYASI